MRTLTIDSMGAWVDMCKKRQEAVAKGSIQALAHRANLSRAKGGRMPVVWGTLRGSFTSTAYGQQLGAAGDAGLLAVMAFNAAGGVGSVIEFTWTVEYARRVNSGFTGTDSIGRNYNQTGAHFIEYATDYFQQIVAQEAKKAEARVKL